MRTGSGHTMELLHPVGRSGAGLQDPQDGSLLAPDSPPERWTDRGTHLRGLPRLLPPGDAAATAESTRTGFDRKIGSGKIRIDPDGGCLSAHNRREGAFASTLHPTGQRPTAATFQTELGLAASNEAEVAGPYTGNG